MESSSHAPAFLRRLPWAALSLAIFSLLFRSFIWASWRPYPGEPYGVADILEFLMGTALLGVCALNAVAGLALLVIRRWRVVPTGVRLLTVGVFLPVVYYVVYPRLPIFRLW